MFTILIGQVLKRPLNDEFELINYSSPAKKQTPLDDSHTNVVVSLFTQILNMA